jgi:hypothetical protein
VTDVASKERARTIAPLPSPTLADLAMADDTAPLPVGLFAAGLCLAIGLAHVQDQGGFLGSESPDLLKVGYYIVEIAAACTIPFLIRQKVVGWLFAALVSIGPFTAYIFSRTTGIPGDHGDIGNWGYVLGIFSLIVEGSLFLLSVYRLASFASRLRRSSLLNRR